ncbi:MAG: type II toxin-antitoxin system RelE/ParE family toxin [Desulfotalea sp.]
MDYSVEFRPAVRKIIKKIPKKDLVKIKSKIDEISSDLPDPATTKMSGNNAFHKVRCGNYRIVYEIHENRVVILVVKIGHRRDVYRNL